MVIFSQRMVPGDTDEEELGLTMLRVFGAAAGKPSISRCCFLVRLVSGKSASVLGTWFGFRENNSAAGMRLGLGWMCPL